MRSGVSRCSPNWSRRAGVARSSPSDNILTLEPFIALLAGVCGVVARRL